MSSGSGTYIGYRLEARLSGDHPAPYDCGNHFILGNHWQIVPVYEGGPFGFRSELWTWHDHSKSLGLIDFEVAMGLAAQMHAQHRLANWRMEFRITRHKVEHSYKTTDDGEGEPFSFDGMQKKYAFAASSSHVAK
jgi:hypothetical protein